MLQEMTAEHLAEWVTFEKLEPFAADREDGRVGAIIAALYNVNRGSKSDKVWKGDEVRPRFGDDIPPLVLKTNTELKETARFITAIFNGS